MMIGKFNKKAFTLVELIVVITIIAILGTIAFISLQGYSANVRDSTRISDLSSIKTSLELFHLDASKYPLPTNPVDIIFSGATLWKEGTFGASMLNNVGKLSTIPVDPLLGNEYTYSVTKDQKEYELGYALEYSSIFSLQENTLFLKQINASISSLRTAITGNYNGKVLITTTGGIDYIFAIPSIITSDYSDNNILNIISNKKLAFDNYTNLPSSYVSKNNYGGFNFSQLDSLVFKGNLDDLLNQDTRLLFYQNICDVYIYSDLEGEEGYELFSAGYIDKFNPTFDYINIACLTVEGLVKRDYGCLGGDQTKNILVGTAYTGALLENGETNYIGQWHFGDSYSSRGQGMGSADHERSSMGMSGGLNKSMGIKWKLFTKPKVPNIYFGGKDINADGIEDMLYGYGGKIFLGDTKTGENIWETKVLDIKTILGVESILGDGTKSVIVALGEDRYIGVINGSNGNLDWISDSALGPVKFVKAGWPGLDYKIFDINGDSINEYHFKQRYKKYNSFGFYESNGKVVGKTLWSSEGYGDYNEGSDGYQPQQWSMGTMSGKLVLGTKGSNTFAFYSNDINSSLTGIDKFKMPAFGKLNVGGNTGNGRSSSIGYFYDLNGDGNDEYISRIDEELNNNKLSRLFVSGLSSTGSVVQYMSLSNPRETNLDGTLISYGNFSNPIALKNYSNLDDSYILSKGRDPLDGVNKWMMLKYNGISSNGFKKNSLENESFNYDILYDKFDSSYSVSGIFNNGEKDYIVLYKSGKFYFYSFTGTGTFLNPTLLEVSGTFFGNTIFDGSYDLNREKNKNAGVFLASYDTDGNGKKEFVTSDGGYFKFYEISDDGIILVKQYGPYNTISGVIKWGLTENLADIYAINYNSTSNAINYYRTDSTSGNYTFTKITSDFFYSGGQITDTEITKLGIGNQRYNKLMVKGNGMYDARNATPSIAPIKLSNDFFNSYDMNKDGVNEIFLSGKAYTFNSPGNYTLKYNSIGWAGDVNGDGVSDSAWSYCESTPTYLQHLFYTIRSGVDGSQIVPDLDWGNGNGWCTGGGVYSNVSEDFDGDGIDELAIGTAARNTRLISLSGSTASGFILSEGNSVNVFGSYNLVSFDFDGDGIKEIIRGHDNAAVFKGDPVNKTKLTHLVDIPGGVKTTWGTGLGLSSLYRFNNITYIAFRGQDGQVVLKSWDGSTVRTLFDKYYVDTKIYNNAQDILNNHLIPLATADVFLGDFMGTDDLQVLIGGGDGYLYIVRLDGSIIRAFNIGVAIKKIIIGDTNEDQLLDIIVSAEDGYVYQIGSSRIATPSFVKDGTTIGYDIVSQQDTKKVGLNFASVNGASGYFVQLYNFTSKSIVFDWIDIGKATSKCIISSDYIDPNCINAGKNFYLSKNSVYQWRVQSYNENISSPTALSNGFFIE